MRLFDHFVLVAGSLPDARKHYRRMGFTVAPDGVHPFGTYNANMYFQDGPMIETLAVENPVAYAKAIATGNSFVKNDAAYREAQGDRGFSHVVLTSSDADRDHAAFQERSVSGGDLVPFSRAFEQPDGRVETIAVKLAFATPAKAQTGFYFTCEDVVAAAVDRSLLLNHENGALGAKQVLSCSRDPLIYVEFLRNLFGADEIRVRDGSVACLAPNGCASIVTPEVLLQDYGIEQRPSGTDLLHSGLVFQVTDLESTKALFTHNNILYDQHDGRLVTRQSPQSRAFFVFEQVHEHGRG